MSNRLSKGTVRVGSLACDTSGGVKFDADQAERKIRALSISATGTTGEVDTAWDLPANGIVHRVWAKITTATTAAGTLSVGLLSSESGGDATGFLNAVGSSSTGDVRGTAVASSSGSPDWFFSSSSLGAFLSVFNAGTTAASDFGVFANREFALSSVTAKSVSYTWNSTDTAGRAKVYIEYTQI